MNRLSLQIGYWSALFCVALFVIFTGCFVTIIVTSPLFLWTDLDNYVAYVQENGQFFANLARFCMLLFAPLFVVLLNVIHENAPADKKLFTRCSISLGILFAGLISLNYFVQITAVRLNLQSGQTTGLEQIVQANPLSAVSAINMLGITYFLGLCSLFLVPVFSGDRLAYIVRYAFLVNAICCLLGAVSYALQLNVLLFITINFGMGGAVMVASAALAVLFKRQERDLPAAIS